MSKKRQIRERPAWDDGTGNQESMRRPPLNPVWAAEVVSMPPRGNVPPIDPSTQGPYVDPMGERLPKKKPGKRFTASGREIPEDDPNMIWQCPYCGAEWYADDPGRCPKCHTDLYAPRPTYGLMHPLIAAMQMIDEGYDPRTGEIDAVMDRLMKEQIEAVGGTRAPPPERPRHDPPKRRLLFLGEDENAPKRRDPGATYVQLVDLPPGKRLTCAICRMQLKQSQRIVRLPCGHHIHSNCLSQWFKTHDDCPTCHGPIANV